MRNRLYGAAAILGALAMLAFAGPAGAQPYGMMGGYGPQDGMMGGGYGPGWMMGPGYGPGSMMGYPHGYMMGPGYGGGYHHGYGMWGYGSGYHQNQGDLKLSVDDVKTYLGRMIHNPNLKVGDVKEKDADTIIAQVVTKKDNSLVQTFEVNRHSGFYQPVQ